MLVLRNSFAAARLGQRVVRRGVGRRLGRGAGRLAVAVRAALVALRRAGCHSGYRAALALGGLCGVLAHDGERRDARGKKKGGVKTREEREREK